MGGNGSEEIYVPKVATAKVKAKRAKKKKKKAGK
jgi:hypothetical protein